MPTRRRPDGTDEARARRLRSAEARPRTVRDIPPRPRADETADEARARADDPTPEGQFDRVCRIKYPPHTQPGTAYHVDGSGAPVVFLGHSCEGMAWGATHSRRGDGKQRRYLFSVGGDDPAKRAFEAGGPGRGVARACERLGVPWLSVGLHRQGLPGGNDNRVPRPLTVVITVSRPPAGEGLARISGAAEMLIHRVEKLLRIKAGDIGSTTDARTGRRCRRPNIQVEVIFPPGADTHDPMEPAGLLSHGQETLHPGRSVGVAGGDGPSGSLSCLVQLTMADGRRALHALASHHVLSRGQPDRLAPLGGTTTNASSPSDADCTSMLRALDRTRGDGGLVGRMHRVNAARRAEGRAPAVSDGAVARWEARMADALRAHGVWHALAPARGMGGVVCSSGIVKPAKGQPMLDWALVGLDSTKIPGRMETV